MNASTEHSLIFIPDITGFSSFVSSTEIGHSQLIIAELLELIIDSDRLGMTVAEVEGDAVLFYKQGDQTTAADLIEQAQHTFYRFNQHLKLYEHQRICSCQACTSAKDLTIKFVAHKGVMEIMQVKNHLKPFGSVVVEAHKLLKNKHDFNEYLLMTDKIDVTEADLTDTTEIAGRYSSDFANVGRVDYAIIDLSSVHDTIDIPKIPTSPSLNSISTKHSVLIPSNMADVLNVFISLSDRMHWVSGLQSIDYNKKLVTRVGTTYLYQFEDKSVQVQVLPIIDLNGRRVYSEKHLNQEDKEESLVLYYFDEDGEHTKVTAEGFVLSADQSKLPRNASDIINGLQTRIEESLDGLQRFIEREEAISA